MAIQIIAEPSVTKLDARHRDVVLVAGSHGGVIAGFLAARAGVRAVILNDAGVGRDQAGISSLPIKNSLTLLKTRGQKGISGVKVSVA